MDQIKKSQGNEKRQMKTKSKIQKLMGYRKAMLRGKDLNQ